MANEITKSRGRNNTRLYTVASSFTLTVPPSITLMIIEGVGGGGGGGGGRGNAAGKAGSGGGGAKRGKVFATVIPGEILTIEPGGGGNGGAGGSSGGGAPDPGEHGADSTVTGSVSGLLATFPGAMGGNLAPASTSDQLFGGLPVKYPAEYVGTDSYVSSPVNHFVAPVAGQGGGTGSSMPRDFRIGGSTAYAEGGSGGSLGESSGIGGGGGASEWPGGNGGDGAELGQGGDGILGSGGAGGSENGLGQPGFNGGNGGSGVILISWIS